MRSSSPPVGPPGHPLLGHAWGLSRGGLEFLRRCADEYGDLVPLRFFWKPVLFVNHPDYVAQVLAVNQRNVVKGMAHRTDHALIGDGLSLREGDAWRRGRRMVQPAFHRERLANYGEIAVRRADVLVGAWRAGEVRDLAAELRRLALAIVAEALFGIDLGTGEAALGVALADALECRNARARSLQLLAPDGLPTPMSRLIQRARRQVDRALDRVIAERREGVARRDDLLSLLLLGADEDGAPLTDDQVRSEVLTFFLAGTETVAALLAWIWYLLAQNPAVEARLLEEIDAVLGRQSPTFADLPRLKYAGAIVSEALRLYPPAPVLEREAIADFDVGGYRVRSGTEIVVSSWVMHRDPRYFADPERFDPDRWADDRASRLPAYAYFPFGGGWRHCIGRSFATVEAILVLAAVASRFRLELLPGQSVVAEPIPTLRPKFGLRVLVHARTRARLAPATPGTPDR